MASRTNIAKVQQEKEYSESTINLGSIPLNMKQKTIKNESLAKLKVDSLNMDSGKSLVKLHDQAENNQMQAANFLSP